MVMNSGLRKFVLATHVASSVGLLGAVAAFFALSVIGLGSDSALARAVYPAMKVTTWFVVLPLAIASLGIGLIESLGTAWGLFRHYWVVAKLAITAVAVAVLLLQLGVIDYMAAVALGGFAMDETMIEARMALVAHSGGGLLLLLVPVALSIYKPQGVTRYWRRRQAGVSLSVHHQ